MAKILVVEDDQSVADNLVLWLKSERHEAEHSGDGKDALLRLELYQYDLIILDWNMPGMTGIEVCRSFRSKGGTTPIIMLTGKDQIVDKETGLDSGADDYLTKPFQMRELAARMRAVMRRPHTISAEKLTVGDLDIDTGSQKVTRNGVEIELSPKEYTILEFFVRNQDHVFSAEVLLNRLWQSDSDATVTTLRTYMYTLRKKLGAGKQDPLIRNVYGSGYILDRPKSPVSD